MPSNQEAGLAMLRRYRVALWKQARKLSESARRMAARDGVAAEIRWQDAKHVRTKAMLLSEIIRNEESAALHKANAVAAVAQYAANHGK